MSWACPTDISGIRDQTRSPLLSLRRRATEYHPREDVEKRFQPGRATGDPLMMALLRTMLALVVLALRLCLGVSLCIVRCSWVLLNVWKWGQRARTNSR